MCSWPTGILEFILGDRYDIADIFDRHWTTFFEQMNNMAVIIHDVLSPTVDKVNVNYTMEAHRKMYNLYMRLYMMQSKPLQTYAMSAIRNAARSAFEEWSVILRENDHSYLDVLDIISYRRNRLADIIFESFTRKTGVMTPKIVWIDIQMIMTSEWKLIEEKPEIKAIKEFTPGGSGYRDTEQHFESNKRQRIAE
jgi:hypothetical protein